MKCNNILEAVGHTPLVRLNRINQGLKPQIYVQGGIHQSGRLRQGSHRHQHDRRSRKKRLAQAGGTIIEGTSGNTGMGWRSSRRFAATSAFLRPPTNSPRKKLIS